MLTEAELMREVKKLVECASGDVFKITLNQKKDIFNGLAAKATNWRSL